MFTNGICSTDGVTPENVLKDLEFDARLYIGSSLKDVIQFVGELAAEETSMGNAKSWGSFLAAEIEMQMVHASLWSSTTITPATLGQSYRELEAKLVTCRAYLDFASFGREELKRVIDRLTKLENESHTITIPDDDGSKEDFVNCARNLKWQNDTANILLGEIESRMDS